MKRRLSVALTGALLAVSVLAVADPAWARAGGGSGSTGSRGSRSYSTPAQPSTTPAPSTSPATTSAQPSSPRPSIFGGFMGGLAGFALGGLLGSMLFGGIGGGFGLLDLLVLGGLAFLAFRMLRRRAEPEPAYATSYGTSAYGTSTDAGGAATATLEPSPGTNDLERGLGHIRQMDAAFDPGALATQARETFQSVQRAVVGRDIATLGDKLTSRMFTELQGQVDRLKSARQTNRVEQIDIRRAEVSEAWQESGEDWVTVYFAGSLVDYTVDDTSGGVIDGSRSPQEFEEFWTFTRPVGPNRWKLSAIQTA